MNLTKKFKCDICRVKYSEKRTLNLHLKAIHNIEPGPRHFKTYECVFCKKLFASKTNFEYHLRLHTQEQPFFCKQCPAERSTKRNLTAHFKRKHVVNPASLASKMNPETKFKCEICEVKFVRKPSLNYHLKTTHQIQKGTRTYKTHECLFCKKLLESTTNLKFHLRIHTQEKPFFCKVCPAESLTKFDLTKHFKRQHEVNPERPFRCEFCTKSFLDSGHLTRHIRTHLGEKPFKCKICSKNFSLNSNLQTHLRVHTGLKPFSCKVCGETFFRLSDLKRHTLAMQREDKPFKCKVCCMSYFRQADLRIHEKKPHSKVPSDK